MCRYGIGGACRVFCMTGTLSKVFGMTWGACRVFSTTGTLSKVFGMTWGACRVFSITGTLSKVFGMTWGACGVFSTTGTLFGDSWSSFCVPAVCGAIGDEMHVQVWHLG